MHILLYSPLVSARLRYICQFIFEEIMSVRCILTSDWEEFKNDNGIKIRYDNAAIAPGHITIGNCRLLFENDIRPQPISCFETNFYKAFFKTENADFPFDIFSASFYLLSRYEEYLPHTKDLYGRYPHENSVAFKEHFLHLPLVNIWIRHFIKTLQQKFPAFINQPLPFRFVPTYDIDMAFSYRHKGLRRNVGGFIKSPSLKRIMVLIGVQQDPFDAYNWLNELHHQHNLQPIYFFLVAQKNGRYDKQILPHKIAMRKLVQEHAKNYLTGIHPSWQSGDNSTLLTSEKKLLESLIHTPVNKSRQHYIRFNLPGSYRQLLNVGITDDYSMGYGSINGFRASVASSFYWFDLQKNEATLLRIHPFCFMEANSFYEQKYTATEAFNELVQYYLVCKEAGGQFITIWHNNFLGTHPPFADWRVLYKAFINQLKT